jgi:hypothetical protein
MENKSLVKCYGEISHLSGQVSFLSNAMDKYGCIPTFFGAYPRAIGLEFEMEGCKQIALSYHNRGDFLYWSFVNDGSLRNSGVEGISKPISGRNIDYALLEIEKVVGHGECEASIRTSIHVHCDVSDWWSKELFQLVAFYSLFEPLFFSLHSHYRQNNPYCYEVTDLLPTEIAVVDDIKYCAFNIAPVSRQLSVEFRHADFSKDMRKNRRWIQLVCKLMHFASNNRRVLDKIIKDTILCEEHLKLFHRVLGKSTQLFNSEEVPEMMNRNNLWALALLEAI